MKRLDFKPGTLLAPLPAVIVSVGDSEENKFSGADYVVWGS